MVNASRGFVSRLVEFAFWVVGGFILAPLVAWLNPWAAISVAIIAVGAAVLTLIGKLSIPLLGTARAAGLIWFAFLFVTAPISIQLQRAEERQQAETLAELRETEPQQYLARIRQEEDETFWLAELQDLDPDEFQEETERRLLEAREATERRQRQAEEAERERIARQEAADAAAVARALQRLEESLERAERDIERPVVLPTSIEDVGGFIIRVERYSTIIENAEGLALDDALEARVTEFRSNLIAFQRREFPRVRDRLGPALRQDLWIDNASARTIGAGYRTIEFTSGRYILNRNIDADYRVVRETLGQLRFNSAVFREYEGGSGSRYDLGAYSPADDEIVVWRNGLPRRLRTG